PPSAMSGIPGTILEADKLHYVGHVSHRDIPPLAQHVWVIPLFYGFTFDACELSYELVSSSKVSLLDLSPAGPSSEFPYPDYPATFPRIPLRLGSQRRMTYADFSHAYPNLEEKQP